MAKLIVMTNVTLDGVMQAPGEPDEDTRGGFENGGWAAPFAAMQQPEAAAPFTNLGALLFGRVTYERFAEFWPRQHDNPFTAFLDEIPKFVVSTTLLEPLPWSHSTLVRGELGTAIGGLKAEREKDLLVFGSGVLVQSLIPLGLVDELTLLIHPLTLGSGRRLFPTGCATGAFRLREAKATATGVVVATYEPVMGEASAPR